MRKKATNDAKDTVTGRDYPGEKMIRRLFETLSGNGIVSLLQPWHLRRELPNKEVLQQLDALSLSWRDIELDSHKRITIDSSSTDDEKTFAERPSGLRPYSRTRAELAKALTQDVIAHGLRQQVNVAKAVLFAESELALDTKAPPDSRIDGDWLQRWRQRAGDISSDELSALWGRILAGEVRHPGSCSLRTLEFLGNLSREEAVDIERVAPFAFGNVLLKHQGLFEKGSVSCALLFRVQELGLISGVGTTLRTNIKSEVEGEFQFTWDLDRLGKRLIISHENHAKVLELPVLHVSRLGREVFRVAQSVPSEEWLVATVMLIEAENYKVRIAEL